MILAEEALTAHDVWCSGKHRLADQPSWSDLPIIILTAAGKVDRETQIKLRFREPLGNLILLERSGTAGNAGQHSQGCVALCRRRQYQMRDYLVERRKVWGQRSAPQKKLAVARAFSRQHRT